MGTFKDLRVWREGVQLAVEIYAVTDDYPATERFGLTAQTRRAAISVSSNIAEGKGRSTPRDFCRFLDIALGSIYEVESQLEVAVALRFVDRERIQAATDLIDKIGRGLTNLKQTHQSR